MTKFKLKWQLIYKTGQQCLLLGLPSMWKAQSALLNPWKQASQPWPLWWAGKLSHPAVYFEGELGFICSHIHFLHFNSLCFVYILHLVTHMSFIYFTYVVYIDSFLGIHSVWSFLYSKANWKGSAYKLVLKLCCSPNENMLEIILFSWYFGSTAIKAVACIVFSVKHIWRGQWCSNVSFHITYHWVVRFIG